jgi:hypothetical protein
VCHNLNSEVVYGTMPKRSRSTSLVRKVTITGNRSSSTFAAAVPVNLRRYVAKAIKKTEEKKSVSLDTGLISFNSAVNSGADCINIVPPVPQGLGSGDRIGNQVKGDCIELNGHIQANIGLTRFTGSGECRLAVRVFVLEADVASNVAVLAWLNGNGVTDVFNNLLKKGDQVGPFAGDVQSLYLPVNQDVYKVFYDKVHMITVPWQRNASTIGVQQVNSSVDLAKSFKFLKIKIPCKKTMQYQNGSSNVPANFSPFMFIGYSHVDGTAADAVDTKIQAQFVSTFNYTDN